MLSKLSGRWKENNQNPKYETSPDIVSYPGPAHEVSVCLHLRVKDRLHSAGVKGVWFGEVDNTKPIFDISLHVLHLIQYM